MTDVEEYQSLYPSYLTNYRQRQEVSWSLPQPSWLNWDNFWAGCCILAYQFTVVLCYYSVLISYAAKTFLLNNKKNTFKSVIEEALNEH